MVGRHADEHRGAFAALDRVVEREIGVPGHVVDDDARILVAADRAAGDFHGERKAVAAVARYADENRRVSTESGEVRPWHVDRALPIVRDGDRFVIGELTVRAARLALALKRADERERSSGTAGGPAAAAVGR